jgi:hypothetical protein
VRNECTVPRAVLQLVLEHPHSATGAGAGASGLAGGSARCSFLGKVLHSRSAIAF